MKDRSTNLPVAWRCAVIVALSAAAIAGCSQRPSPDQAAEMRGRAAAATQDTLGTTTRPANSKQTATPTCETSHLTLSLDGGDGRFNGMSHSGTSLQLSNRGTVACAVPVRPRLGFSDADGKTLDINPGEPTADQAADRPPLALAPGLKGASV